MPAKRGSVSGWSKAAARRNTKFLYSIRESDLHGKGFAITLTLKRCPPTHDDWQRLLTAYIRRLERMGYVRLHWVTEWQRRGVPHLHFAVWYPVESQVTSSDLINHWLDAGASDYGSPPHGQFVTPIDGPVGWFQYVSKHASRGAGHYQRCPDAIPKTWSKTGRMWGKRGDWPADEGMKVSIDKPGFFAYRRIVRNMRVADARASGSRKRLRQARQMLKSSDRPVSEVRGVSEWVSMATQLSILAHLGGRGFEIEQTE